MTSPSRSSFRRSLIGSALAAVTLTISHAGPAGAPLGNELLVVTTNVAGIQQAPAVARDADGDAVVVWQGAASAADDNVYLRRLNNYGVSLGTTDTLVNGTVVGKQGNPAVAMNAVGNFVVVWESEGQDGDQGGVYGQRYNAAGVAQGTEFKVNTFVTEIQGSPTVALAANGSFVVAWESRTQDGSGYGVYAQRYNAAGAVQGAEFRVNTTTNFSQRYPSIASDLNGNVVIAWQSTAQDGDLGGIYAQRYMADGTAVGGEFRLNSITAGDQGLPSIALRPNGQLVASWMGPDAGGTGIYTRRFDVTNAALDASDVLVNTTTTDSQAAPSIATDADGDTVVAWESTAQDAAGGTGVYFQRFSASGTATGNETLVNGTTAGSQAAVAVAVDADGDIVASWAGAGAGDSNGVFARRFAGPESVDLSITKADNADPATTNGSITYTLSVANLHAVSSATGNAVMDAAIGTATNMVVTDTLPAGLSFQSATGTNWTCTNAAGVVTCTYGSATNPLPFAAGATSSITLTASTGVAAPANNRVVNAATITADQFDAITTNNAASEPTNVCGPTDNTGSFSVANVAAGENAGTATITVTRSTANNGQLLCGPASVSYATSNGTATSPGDYTPASGTLNFPDSAAATPGTGADTQTMSFTVPVIDDVLDENAETVNITLSKPSPGTLNTATAMLTITDNDAPPVASITTADASVAESASSKTLTLTLSTISGRDVTLPYSFAGTASNGGAVSDYTASPATQVVIAAGQTTGTVTLNIVDDTRDEDDETIITTLPAATGTDPSYSLGTPNSQTTTITDNDAQPALSISDRSLAEGNSGSSNMVFTVQLSAISGRTVTVSYATANGTATAGSDYTSATGTATIAAGTSSTTINVPVLGDTLNEDNETFTLTLSAPVNASIAAPASVTGTITDDDAAPSVSFTAASQSVAENLAGGTASITATLSAPSGRTVTVPFTLGGTATQGTGSDYTIASANPIVFNPGETSRTLTVSINNDTLDENDETVLVSLTSPTNATVGATANHTLTITDDDATPTVRFSAAAQSALENVASGTATATITLSAVSGRDVAVPYTVGGTASNGSDYSLSPASPVLIAAGGLSADVTVRIVNDAAAEPGETVVLNIGTPTNATSAAPATHTLTIQDDDSVPQVFFDTASQTVGEASGTASIAVRLSRTADDDITLNYSLSGTATQGNTADYRAITPANPIIISAGTPASGVLLSIPINDDTLAEGNETVVITLTNAVNATIVTPGSHTLTITDNDSASVIVRETGGSTNVTEGAATDGYSLVLSSMPTQGVTINISGTAQASVSPGSVSFTTANWNVPQSITITAVDDAAAEGNHSTVITQTATSGDPSYSGIAVPNVTVAIVDNDSPGVSVAESGGSTNVSEGGATDSYTLVLTRQPTANVSISITPNAQVSTSLSSVTFTNANWNVPQSVTVTAVDDAAAEGTHSGMIAHGNTVSSDATFNGLSVSSVRPQITDNDSVGLVFSKSSVSVAEGGATDSYTVRLNSQPSANVTVTLDGASQLQLSTGGSAFGATASLSFTSISSGPGGWNVPQAVQVRASDDNIAEGPHSGMVTHSTSSSDAGYQLGMAGVVNATIADKGGATLSINDVSVNEGNSGTTNANFVVSLSSPSSQPVSVNFVTVAGTATEGTDYQAATGTLTIPAGATSGIIAIGVVGDTLNEVDETYSVQLSNAVNATLIKGTGNGTITNDDALPSVRLGISGSPFAENGGVATITAFLSEASSQTVTVNLAFTGTASTAVDYRSSATSIVIPPGARSGTASLTGLDDARNEGDESVVVDIDSVVNGSELEVQRLTATIGDDDTAGLLFVESDGDTRLTEGAGSDSYTVALRSQPLGTVTVSLVTDAPISASPSSLTFDAGNWNVAQTVTLSAASDGVAGGNGVRRVNHNISASNPADAGYNGQTQALSVNYVDSEQAGVIASKSALNITEGDAGDSYTIQLSSRPSAPVTLTLSNTANVKVNPASLSFTVDNWNLAQTVTVSADRSRNSNRIGVIRTTVSSADINFNNLAVNDVNLTVKSGGGSQGGGAFGGVFGLLALLGARRLRRRLLMKRA